MSDLKVLISATSRDLADHRKTVVEAIERLGMMPLFADLEGSKNAVADAYAQVDEADIYVGIIGVRYGFVPRQNNTAERSVGELQYRRAAGRGIPMLVFLSYDDATTTVKTGELEAISASAARFRRRLQAFRTEIMTAAHGISRFHSVRDVAEAVIPLLEKGREIALLKKATMSPLMGGYISPEETHTKPLLLHLRAVMSEETPNAASAIRKPEIDPGKEMLPPSELVSVPLITATEPPAQPPPPEVSITSPTEDDSTPQPYDLTALLTPMGCHPAASTAIPKLPTPFLPHAYAETGAFFGRESAAAALNEWALSPNHPMLVLTGSGGMGKTVTAWRVCQWAATSAHFVGVIWWRVSESDGSLANFIRRTLAYITEQPLEVVNQMSAAEREKALLAALKKRSLLLVLDGVERWLSAYFKLDAAYFTEAQKNQIDGTPIDSPLWATSDPAIGFFLAQLALCAPSKVLITSRMMVKTLAPLPNVRELKLEGLKPDDGATFLDFVGVKGGDGIEVSRALGGNPLMLRLVAGQIIHDLNGDLALWQSRYGVYLTNLEMTARRPVILEQITRELPADEKAVLQQMSVFRTPVHFAAIYTASPFAPPPPPKMNAPRRWQADYAEAKTIWDANQEKLRLREAELETTMPRLIAALRGLAQRRLLTWNTLTNRLELHPIVRGEVFGWLSLEERALAFERAILYYERLPVEGTMRDISDLHPALEIYNALINTGRLDAAAERYRANLGKAMIVQLTSPYQTIELLRPLFPEGFRKLPALKAGKDRGYFTNEMALMFGYIGQTSDALALLGLTIGTFLEEHDAPSLNAALIHYAGLLRDEHRMAAKVHTFELARDLSEALGDMETLAISHLFLLKSYVDNGQWESAEASYRAFNDIPAQHRSPGRQATAERVYAKMLICKGEDATMALSLAWELAMQSKSITEQRAIHALWGESALQQGRPDAAERFFRAALELSPHPGGSAAIYLGGLARALADLRRFDEARAALARGATPSTAAHALIALGEKEKARLAALEGYRSAWADGVPFTFWWELDLSRKALAKLDMAEPHLPPFDPLSVAPIPHEDGIRLFVDTLRASRAGSAS
ncbi:MAG: DUF4062 domain-containing protein [Anaerolineales bacterium]|nr:DUF4062 domain-containing protein [Anaerolineales bacterium]